MARYDLRLPACDYNAAVRRYDDEIGKLEWAAIQDDMFTPPVDTCRNPRLLEDLTVGGDRPLVVTTLGAPANKPHKFNGLDRRST
jgi:hypothetical protein